jgi:hypothetical protein
MVNRYRPTTASKTVSTVKRRVPQKESIMPEVQSQGAGDGKGCEEKPKYVVAEKC